VRNGGLVVGIGLRLAGLGKVRPFDAAGEGVHARVPFALGFVEALAARKHEVALPNSSVSRSSSSGGAPRKADSSSMQSYTVTSGSRWLLKPRAMGV
jgi:hypothetical protein